MAHSPRSHTNTHERARTHSFLPPYTLLSRLSWAISLPVHFSLHTHNKTKLQVELFKEISRRIYWLGDIRSWTFDCVPWTDLLDDLNSPNGTCLIAPAVGAYDVYRPSWVVDKEGE